MVDVIGGATVYRVLGINCCGNRVVVAEGFASCDHAAWWLDEYVLTEAFHRLWIEPVQQIELQVEAA